MTLPITLTGCFCQRRAFQGGVGNLTRGNAHQNRCTRPIMIILEVKSLISCLLFLQLRAAYTATNIYPRFQLDMFGVKLSRYLCMDHSLASKAFLHICYLVIYLELDTWQTISYPLGTFNQISRFWGII